MWFLIQMRFMDVKCIELNYNDHYSYLFVLPGSPHIVKIFSGFGIANNHNTQIES